MKKLCGVCGTEKPVSDFGKGKNKSGLKYLCKVCHNEKNNILRAANRGKYRKANLAYARSDRGKTLQRANNLRRKFWPHLTNEQAVAEYDRLLAVQKNCCAICRKHQSQITKNFDVDHCHKTGKVRGLLCHKCNYAFVKDHSLESLQKLVDYLNSNY